MAEAAFDHVNLAKPRTWTDKERAEVTRALGRHAYREVARYNLCGVHFDGDAAIATDGHRLLCVRSIADKALHGKTLAVHNGALTPWALDVTFPEWRKSLTGNRARHFILRNAKALRRSVRKSDLPVCLTPHGLILGHVEEKIVAVQAGFLADVPATDDELIVSVDSAEPGLNPVIVSPEHGGWFAAIMPVRTGGLGMLAPWTPKLPTGGAQ